MERLRGVKPLWADPVTRTPVKETRSKVHTDFLWSIVKSLNKTGSLEFPLNRTSKFTAGIFFYGSGPPGSAKHLSRQVRGKNNI